MKDALDELTEWVAEWEELKKVAMQERGDKLNIYDIGETHGKLCWYEV